MAEQNKDLVNLELFEIEALEYLNNVRLLGNIFFGGGTMLRLCHGLNRYSTDLDFWLKPDAAESELFLKINTILSEKYSVTDAQNKHYRFVFQIRSPLSKRSLKIEIRKNQENFEWGRIIAFSPYSTKQVQLNALTLNQMMSNKISALLSRKLIRDAFDIDFLVKRGIEIDAELTKLENMYKIINSFKERDFKVTLGSLLEKSEREYVINEKFNFLKRTILAKINKQS